MISIRCGVVSSLVCLILSSAPADEKRADENGTWKAGLASAVVTPEKPMWMAGYASRNKPSEGKVQDLFVKALALESADGHKMEFITSDLISVPRPIRDVLENRLQRNFSCRHTV